MCTGAEIPIITAAIGAAGKVGSSLIGAKAGGGGGGGGGGGFVDKPTPDILGIFDRLSNPDAGGGLTPPFNPNAGGIPGIGGMGAGFGGGLLGIGENLLQAFLMKKLFGGNRPTAAAPAPDTSAMSPIG